jgi:hypothetical protein
MGNDELGSIAEKNFEVTGYSEVKSAGFLFY